MPLSVNDLIDWFLVNVCPPLSADVRPNWCQNWCQFMTPFAGSALMQETVAFHEQIERQDLRGQSRASSSGFPTISVSCSLLESL